jgi:hypothetical protein
MRTLVLAALFCLAALVAHAQISVELLLDQDQYLRDESLPIKARITNRSGQPVELAKEDDWLRFTIEERERKVVSQNEEMKLAGEFKLESAFAATRTVDLMPYYDLKPGRYTVFATVKVKQWEKEFSTPSKTFEIVRGTKIWEQEFGIPSNGGTPEARKYILQQAQYQKHLMLYLRVTDSLERQVYSVVPVGTLVSFARPEAQVDGASQLHLLFQTGARAFRYFVYDPSGEVITRQTHDYASTRPVLRSNDAGKIFVTGGARHLAPDDYPPLTAAAKSSTNDVSIPKP